MHYLIDGHNLIAQMPDIDLADPDDEIRLLERLRIWAAASPKRRLTLYFDGGRGGKDRRLSSGPVTVIFSSARRTADDLIIQRLETLKDPGKFKLVSSDRAIIAVARARRVAQVQAEVFAAQLIQERMERLAPPAPPSPKEDPSLSATEVDAWLAEFGPVPARKPPPRRRRKTAPPPPEPPAPPPLRSAAELKESEAALNETELAEWLALFGDGEQGETATETETGAGKTPKPRQSARRRSRAEPRPADKLKASGAGLSQDEVDAWLTIFRDERKSDDKD